MRLLMLSFIVVACGCSRITVDVLTQAPPGRNAFVDVETDTLHVTRGVAVALECHESNDGYYGPCRGMNVVLDDDEIAAIIPAHLDALPNQYVRSPYSGDDETVLTGPEARQGFVVAAQNAGSAALTITAETGEFPMTLVVEDPPAPPGDNVE
jgi:hypothetical protein